MDALFPNLPIQETPTHRQKDSHVLIQCPNCKGEGTTRPTSQHKSRPE